MIVGPLVKDSGINKPTDEQLEKVKKEFYDRILPMLESIL